MESTGSSRPRPAAGAAEAGTGAARDEASLSSAKQELLRRRLRQSRATASIDDGIRPVPRDGPLAPSLQQEDLWFLDRLAPGLPIYNVDFVLRFRGRLDATALQHALDALVARHESLRTRFTSSRGVPRLVIDPPAPLPLPVEDLREVPAGRREEAAREVLATEARRPFDLEAGPLFRVTLLRLDPADHVLLLSVHHIVVDGWSVGTLTRELTSLYEACRKGEGDPLPPLPIQYADFAAWQREWLTGDALEGQLAYWREQLEDLPTLDFPADRPRPARPTWAGDVVTHHLPASLYEDLQRLARGERVTLLAPLLAAFSLVLARYTGQTDVPVGSVSGGRTRSEVEPLIGFFVNTVVLRTSVEGDPTFRELLERANEVALGALGHQDLPFGKLVDHLRPERDAGRNPLFQIALTLQIPLGRIELEDLTVEERSIWEFGVYPGTARFDMTVNLVSYNDRFMILTEYSTELYTEARIAALHGHLQRVLEHAVAAPDTRAAAFDLLSGEERARLEDWSQRHAGSPLLDAHAPGTAAGSMRPVVLEPSGQPAPAGVPGTLWLVPEAPAGGDGEAGLQPTGVRARWTLDGELEVLDGAGGRDVAGDGEAAPAGDPQAWSQTQRELGEIWQEVLGAAPGEVPLEENFFVAGGSSLQAVQLMTRIREVFGVEIDLPTIFAEGSIAELAALLDAELDRAAADLPAEEVQRLLAELDDISEEEAVRLLGGGAAARPPDQE